jgi:peroxiredoxin Q/BCP
VVLRDYFVVGVNDEVTQFTCICRQGTLIVRGQITLGSKALADTVTQTARVKKPKRTMLAAAAIVLLLAAYWFSLSTQYDLLPVGSPAPSFTLTAADGSQVSLEDSGRHGRSAILVFYPGDNTAVCTAQLCALRDSWSEVKAAGADVYGINPASQETHQDFVRRNRYPFPLLVDASEKVSSLYGCRAIGGLLKRTVYIIGPDGRIAWAQRGKPEVSQILAALGRVHRGKVIP